MDEEARRVRLWRRALAQRLLVNCAPEIMSEFGPVAYTPAAWQVLRSAAARSGESQESMVYRAFAYATGVARRMPITQNFKLFLLVCAPGAPKLVVRVYRRGPRAFACTLAHPMEFDPLEAVVDMRGANEEREPDS